MCIVCVEYVKGKMTAKEALRAIGEMVPKDEEEKEHFDSVADELWIEDWIQNTTQTE
jgi:RNase H-fold protein (predicted Holliday junction resolvase)